MISVKQLVQYLESIAPPALQENYDNSGLITGSPEWEVSGVLVALDCLEEVVDEAISLGCNVIVAHHPIVFSGMKRLNGKNYIERTVIKAIQNNIAIYAIHTNLDNIRGGVNKKIADRIGLKNTRILVPKKGLLRKLVTFSPANAADGVRQALFAAGAGGIGNYDQCSFNVNGTGTFRAGVDANPVLGSKGVVHNEPEVRIEVIYEFWKEASILNALRSAHPYEEIAYDLYPLENALQDTGAGMIGELEHPMDEREFLLKLKKVMEAEVVRHTRFLAKKVQKIAVCGGSGSFLLNDAKKAGADILVTADFKYHQFFDAESQILVADIGHFETEQFTCDLLSSLISEKFPTFAVRLTGVKTNPVHYLY